MEARSFGVRPALGYCQKCHGACSERELPPQSIHMACVCGPAVAVSPLEWPHITITTDQGSDAWSAIWFLRHSCTNATILLDPSHRVWRDVRNALKQSQHWSSALSLLALVNYESGPWRNQAFYNQQVEAIGEFLKVTGPGDQVYEHLRPWLLRDLGMEHRVCEDGLDEEVLAA
eukprot:4440701-Amphidinium_carterae.1